MGDEKVSQTSTITKNLLASLECAWCSVKHSVVVSRTEDAAANQSRVYPGTAKQFHSKQTFSIHNNTRQGSTM